jgi:hypothetical protein
MLSLLSSQTKLTILRLSLLFHLDVIVLPGGSSPRPPFSRFARRAVTGNLKLLTVLAEHPSPNDQFQPWQQYRVRANRAQGGLGGYPPGKLDLLPSQRLSPCPKLVMCDTRINIACAIKCRAPNPGNMAFIFGNAFHKI